MRINHNLQSLRALNNQTKILKKNDTYSAKISSGMAINKAADDAAGLSISEGMRAQIRGLVQADRNIQDAESLLQTAEGVLGGTSELLQRMRELTIQAQNDTLTQDDRMMIQSEFRQLQLAVDGSPEEATWSGMSVVDMHEPVFSQIEGNRHFPGGVRIIEGYNDDLEITIDGVLKTLKIAEGTYEPVEVLVDYLDDVMMELDPNIIIHLTEDRTLSIQAENHASIDQISGGASSLFYEYELGRPPGMIVGVTKYQGGEVKSIPGVSDELTLYVGSDRQYTITFPPGTYSRQEAIDEINRQLVAKGENDAKAEAYGEERIALVSNKYVITGLGGNMIEIDNITSILYDNRKKGSITKTQAAVSGYKDLTAGVQIEKGVNDRLTFYSSSTRSPNN
ncbi:MULTISPECIES: flagellin [unclassified Sporosarcina]|uniref:flagellin n=1 Tax=unclassified Sporosarcina TaxID=2647733 RepID=UPI00203B0941|nr:MULTISPECIES: flagellin [unclassified Sporosarcina]GKV64845.1 hypothetical protein NCCP2331_09980 [Sporosarcina sp. NCCP-2331]GLB54955.1 hypothetical protein NCCP2378_07400 [Sporosarcina sp. NCCP-2378]